MYIVRERGLQIFPQYPTCYLTAWVVGQSKPVRQCDGVQQWSVEDGLQHGIYKACKKYFFELTPAILPAIIYA